MLGWMGWWSVLGWMMDGMDEVDGGYWDVWDGWSVLGWMECRFVAWP